MCDIEITIGTVYKLDLEKDLITEEFIDLIKREESKGVNYFTKLQQSKTIYLTSYTMCECVHKKLIKAFKDMCYIGGENKDKFDFTRIKKGW